MCSESRGGDGLSNVGVGDGLEELEGEEEESDEDRGHWGRRSFELPAVRG